MRRLGILFGAMAVVLSGCFWFLPEEAIQFTFEETVYGYEATVDF